MVKPPPGGGGPPGGPSRCRDASQVVFASRIPLRLLMTRGLVVESCADLVWKLSFVLVLGHLLHSGLVRGTTWGCLWGPGGLPQGARRLPRDNPRRPKPRPWRVSGPKLSKFTGLGAIRGPKSINSYVLVTSMAPNLINSYGLVTYVAQIFKIHMVWWHPWPLAY